MKLSADSSYLIALLDARKALSALQAGEPVATATYNKAKKSINLLIDYRGKALFDSLVCEETKMGWVGAIHPSLTRVTFGYASRLRGNMAKNWKIVNNFDFNGKYRGSVASVLQRWDNEVQPLVDKLIELKKASPKI